MRIGKCLCGASKITIPMECTKVGICHCSMCRKMCSGPWMAIQTPIENTIITGEHIKTYKSSKFANRRFCNKCGTTLTYESKHSPFIVVSAGIFDDQTGFSVSHEIFSDNKASWYEFNAASDRSIMTRNQTLLHYLPKMIGYGIKSRLRMISNYFGKA